MLKINLLPPYIYEKRKVIKTAIAFGVLLVALVAGMLAWWTMLGTREKDLNARLADATARANEVTRIEGEVAAELGKAPVILAKVDFINNLMAYNVEVPKLYEELAKYTYSRVVYSGVSTSGSSLSVNAHARTVGDCGRYLLNMYRASHVFSSVTISSVPGWPAGSSGGGGAMPGMMAAGMGPGGMPGMPPMPGMGPGGMPGMPGMGAPSASSSAVGGFDFTVNCALVKPITAPAYTSGGAAAAGAELGGMPGGMGPGGMPGMGPGGPGMPPGMGPAGPGMPPGAAGPGAPPTGPRAGRSSGAGGEE